MPSLGDCDRLGSLVGGTDPRRCGSVPVEGGIESLAEAVLPIDEVTRARMREVRVVGRRKGRRAQVFGLVGDSITAGELFLGPFSHSSSQGYAMSPWVREQLAVPRRDGSVGTIVDFYRGVEAEKQPGFFRDSFRATRAARTGAPSPWALSPDEAGLSPVDRMIRDLSPAVALLMYGSNDAVARVAPSAQLAEEFRESMGRIVDRLEAEGIVVVLWTIPRRGPQPELEKCGRDGARTNARLMVQTNAISAAAATLACERALPLVDMRSAFDRLVSRGLFSDGVHPSSHRAGSGQLTEEGLRCGYNARNYLALRALRQVHDALALGDEASAASAK